MVTHVHFLAGEISIVSARLASLSIADESFTNVAAFFEVPDRTTTVDFPIDGIFGAGVLRQYEWWFDYDGGRCWLRPV